MSKVKNFFVFSKKKEPGNIAMLLRVAVPLIITTSSQSIMQFVDRMFLSWHSADALAACLPAGLISFSIVSFFMGTAGYTGVFVANYFGQKRYASLSIALWQGIIAGLISWFIILALVPFGNFLIDISHHADEVKVLEKQYFTILTIFGGLTVINNALAGFFTGRGKTAITMSVNLFGNILNAFLTYVFVFGKLGFPAIGIKGAAISTVIGGASVSIIFFAIILSPAVNKKFKIGKLFGFNANAMTRLVRYGLPSGFSFFMDIFSFSVFAFFTGNIDKLSLAASNIVLTLQSIIFMPLLGIAIAVQILTGQYVGKKQPELGVKMVFTALKTGALYVAVVCVLFLAAPQFFTGLFAGGVITEDMRTILQKTGPLMIILCCFTWGDLTYLIFGDAIRGAGDTKFHMKAMIICAIVLIVGSWLIIEICGGGITVAWLWITFYAWATGAVMTWRFLSRRWMGIDITA